MFMLTALVVVCCRNSLWERHTSAGVGPGVAHAGNDQVAVTDDVIGVRTGSAASFARRGGANGDLAGHPAFSSETYAAAGGDQAVAV